MIADSKLTLIPGDPNVTGGPPVRVGTYRIQVISGVLAQLHLSGGPPNSSCGGDFPGSRMHNQNRHAQQLAASPCWESKEMLGYLTEGEKVHGRSENVAPKA